MSKHFEMNRYPNEIKRVLCPYCNAENNLEDYITDGIEETDDEECYECGNFFGVRIEFDPLVYIRRLEEDEQ